MGLSHRCPWPPEVKPRLSFIRAGLMDAAACVRDDKKKGTKVPDVALCPCSQVPPHSCSILLCLNRADCVLPGALKEQGTVGRVPFGVISIDHLGFSQEQSLGCVTAARRAVRRSPWRQAVPRVSWAGALTRQVCGDGGRRGRKVLWA